MKKLIFIILLAVAGLLYAYSTPVNTETMQHTWVTLRSAVDSNDTALTATTKDWADKPATSYVIPPSFNNVELRFRCDPNSTSETTATYTVYLYPENDDAVLVCTGSITRGDQVATMGAGAYYYAETVTVTSSWATDITTADVSGANGMGRIAFDCLGYKYIYVQITALKQYDKVSVDMRGF